jgi:hypothetical protein
MTSEKKADANRRNALKSTGPKTPEGKDAVRLNALKHGLRSEEILLPGEDGEALRELDERLRNELQPVGELENVFVDRIITAYWRLRRLGRVEAGIFAWQLYGELRERAQREARSYKRNILDDIVEQDATITDEHKRQEALSIAQDMNAKQEAETATLGRTFIRDANAQRTPSPSSPATRLRSIAASTKHCTNSSASKPPAALMATLHRLWR